MPATDDLLNLIWAETRLSARGGLHELVPVVQTPAEDPSPAHFRFCRYQVFRVARTDRTATAALVI